MPKTLQGQRNKFAIFQKLTVQIKGETEAIEIKGDNSATPDLQSLQYHTGDKTTVAVFTIIADRMEHNSRLLSIVRYTSSL